MKPCMCLCLMTHGAPDTAQTQPSLGATSCICSTTPSWGLATPRLSLVLYYRVQKLTNQGFLGLKSASLWKNHAYMYSFQRGKPSCKKRNSNRS